MNRLDGKERVQAGVRLEKRLVKVLKALAELYDLSLGELMEDLVRDAFAGRQPLSDVALGQAAELMRIHGLPPAASGAPAQEGPPGARALLRGRGAQALQRVGLRAEAAPLAKVVQVDAERVDALAHTDGLAARTAGRRGRGVPRQAHGQ
ncbi:MAG TPA: hypothetical protein VMW75_16630 [Thermoanaerobaculia bacterium]|nr:hypothetical protein [Thermoanaerobaculia bacterium]